MDSVWLSFIPTLLTGVCLFLFQQQATRREKQRDEKDGARNEYIKILVDLTLATQAVSEANAIALKRGQCNGETEKALEYARQMKHKHRDFLERNGIRNLF